MPEGLSLRDRTERRAVATSSAGDAGLATLLVIGTVALVWTCTYGAGGSKTVLPHAFYVPVVIAAIRFRARGALVTSVAAGLAAGPFMPLDVAARTAQPTLNWAGRLVFFVLVGQLVAYLSHHSVPSLTRELSLRRLRGELDAAITTGQLRLEYQPIVDLGEGSLVGVEALIRWDHPDRGAIAPDDFIPDAERAGCVDRVTRFLIAEACHQVDQWRDALPPGVDFTLAVNVSALDSLTTPSPASSPRSSNAIACPTTGSTSRSPRQRSWLTSTPPPRASCTSACWVCASPSTTSGPASRP